MVPHSAGAIHDPWRFRIQEVRDDKLRCPSDNSGPPEGEGTAGQKTRETDVVVLGRGPGGEDAATRLARAGLAVTAVEDRLVGGECPYWGCVPSKMMTRAAGLLTEGRRIPGLAGDSVITPSWAPVARRIRDEATDGWDDKVAADRLTAAGVTLLRGHGTITGPGEVTVSGTGGTGGGQVLRARRGILVNTGTVPAISPVPGLAGTAFWTNHEAVETEQVPASLIVLGGGAIGCELAQVFARFGSEVHVAEAAGQLLPTEEPESGALLADVFRREGIGVHTGSGAGHIGYDGTRFTVSLANGDELTAERLLVATGRKADLAAFGLAVHAAVPVPRLREMIYAYPAFHRAVESALADLADQDGPYS